jgi:hypothetical protein
LQAEAEQDKLRYQADVAAAKKELAERPPCDAEPEAEGAPAKKVKAKRQGPTLPSAYMVRVFL